MDNGLIAWIPERFSLQLIVLIIVFILPGFCIFMFATLMPLMIWGEFWKQFVKDNNARGGRWKKQNIFFMVSTICIAATMYVVWIRWLWSFSDADNSWITDILIGKSNSN